MTSGPSQLNDKVGTLVIDASVAINLLGTGQAAAILRLIGRPILIESTARLEVRRDPATGAPAEGSLEALAQARLLTFADLESHAHPSFLALVGANPPDDLDDGEAATIALATDLGAALVLDDRKALRVARQSFPGIVLLQTVDLLCSQVVTAGMARDTLAEAVFAALQRARMRVPSTHRAWVVDLIGSERAALCPSLGSLR